MATLIRKSSKMLLGTDNSQAQAVGTPELGRLTTSTAEIGMATLILKR